jgi:hypothetical protein
MNFSIIRINFYNLIGWFISESGFLKIGDHFKDHSYCPDAPAQVILKVNKIALLREHY